MKTTPSITYIYRMCHSGIHILFLLISYLQFWIMKHQSIDTWRKTSQECNTVLTSQYETLFWSFCVDITIWFVYPFKCISLIPFSRQRSGFINFMNDEERRLFWQKSKSLFWRKTVRKPKSVSFLLEVCGQVGTLREFSCCPKAIWSDVTYLITSTCPFFSSSH